MVNIGNWADFCQIQNKKCSIHQIVSVLSLYIAFFLLSQAIMKHQQGLCFINICCQWWCYCAHI